MLLDPGSTSSRRRGDAPQHRSEPGRGELGCSDDLVGVDLLSGRLDDGDYGETEYVEPCSRAAIVSSTVDMPTTSASSRVSAWASATVS